MQWRALVYTWLQLYPFLAEIHGKNFTNFPFWPPEVIKTFTLESERKQGRESVLTNQLQSFKSVTKVFQSFYFQSCPQIRVGNAIQ